MIPYVISEEKPRIHFVKTYGKGRSAELAVSSLTGCDKPSAVQIQKQAATPFPTEVTCPHCKKKISTLEEIKCLTKLMIPK